MKTAVITGASSGLGVDFLKAVVQNYPEMEEIWLIARRKERLEKLAEHYKNVKIRAIGLDLADEASYGQLKELLEKEKPQIRILVNNAGVCKGGDFGGRTLEELFMMVNLNVKGGTAVARLCLPYMGKGSIAVFTSSVSSFVPIAGQGVYSSTKSYLTYLGRALHEEWKREGIHVCVLCPGNMATEMNPIDVEKASKSKIGKLPYLDTRKVAAETLNRAEKGKACYTPGRFYRAYQTAGKILPHSLMMKLNRL